LAVGLVSQFGTQVTLGFVLTFVFIFTFLPDLFPAFGLLLPLGFAQGPGQASSIGQSWVPDGFAGADTVGLTFAAIGFMWACFGGIYLVNRGIRKQWVDAEALGLSGGRDRSGVFPRQDTHPHIGMHLTTDSMAVDSNSYHVALVAATYLLTWLGLKLLEYLLAFAGPMGTELAENLWAIAFIFCALVAMVVRAILNRTGIQYTIDNAGLTRIAGFCVDFMVAGALGAISVQVVALYWAPITIMSILAGLQAIILVPWMGSRMYPDNKLGRTVIVYGASTGTLATGLALLRVIDPDFKSPVATDYMTAAAIVFVFAIPLIMALNLPINAYRAGDPSRYWWFLGVCLAYLFVPIIGYVALARRRSFARIGHLWYSGSEE
jgi:ESS family glutamate:Na+ symporter